MSPSSRRAWIEISAVPPLQRPDRVALLAEGVDRNLLTVDQYRRNRESPSSRRAWIEISPGYFYCDIPIVALLAEGVDRN